MKTSFDFYKRCHHYLEGVGVPPNGDLDLTFDLVILPLTFKIVCCLISDSRLVNLMKLPRCRMLKFCRIFVYGVFVQYYVTCNFELQYLQEVDTLYGYQLGCILWYFATT